MSSIHKKITAIAFLSLFLATSANAQQALDRKNDQPVVNIEKRKAAQLAVKELADDIQNLKTSVIALNKDIRTLEEDMLFPANTQLTVFVSLDIGNFFTLETAKLKIDGKLVTSHLYKDKELSALANSGIQRLYVGNISNGDHEITAFFTGKGPQGRPFKRGTSLKVSKSSGSKYVELHIGDSTSKEQPEFTVKQW